MRVSGSIRWLLGANTDVCQASNSKPSLQLEKKLEHFCHLGVVGDQYCTKKKDELQKHTNTEMVELQIDLKVVPAGMLTVTILMLLIYYHCASLIHFVVILPPSC